MNLLDVRDRATITVEDAATLLGIGRGNAYQQARCFLATGEGLPVVRIGRRLLVPVPRLLRMLGVSEGRAG